MLDLIENANCWFSHVKAHLSYIFTVLECSTPTRTASTPVLLAVVQRSRVAYISRLNRF